jgi:hypothetical protein
LEKAVHRHDAAALAIGIPEHLLFRYALGARVDRLEIRSGVRVMRNQAPPQPISYREPGFRMPAEYNLAAPRRPDPRLARSRLSEGTRRPHPCCARKAHPGGQGIPQASSRASIHQDARAGRRHHSALSEGLRPFLEWHFGVLVGRALQSVNRHRLVSFRNCGSDRRRRPPPALPTTPTGGKRSIAPVIRGSPGLAETTGRSP